MIVGTVTTSNIGNTDPPVTTSSTSIEGIVRSVLNISGVVPVGDVQTSQVQFLPRSSFPEVGSYNTLYVDTTDNSIYYWDGAMYVLLSASSEDYVVAKTVAEWETVPSYPSKKGILYVYLDYRQENGVNIPAMKVGDGNSYVVDLPFFDTGVTQSDRAFWDNKVAVTLSNEDSENLIFYTDRR